MVPSGVLVGVKVCGCAGLLGVSCWSGSAGTVPFVFSSRVRIRFWTKSGAPSLVSQASQIKMFF